MDFIPIEPEGDLGSLFESFTKFPFSFVRVNNPGDYENESMTFKAEEDIESLYRYMLIYEVEDMETGLPEYSKSRCLTFADIELPKGSLLQIYTRHGEESTDITFETGALHHNVYWGLDEPICHVPHSTIEILERGDSYSVSLTNR